MVLEAVQDFIDEFWSYELGFEQIIFHDCKNHVKSLNRQRLPINYILGFQREYS